jgi:hypothetical protein
MFRHARRAFAVEKLQYRLIVATQRHWASVCDAQLAEQLAHAQDLRSHDRGRSVLGSMVERLTLICFLQTHDTGIPSIVSRPLVTDFLSAFVGSEVRVAVCDGLQQLLQNVMALHTQPQAFRSRQLARDAFVMLPVGHRGAVGAPRSLVHREGDVGPRAPRHPHQTPHERLEIAHGHHTVSSKLGKQLLRRLVDIVGLGADRGAHGVH